MAEVDEIINEPSEGQKRINELSKKAKEAEEAKETAEKARIEAEARATEATKLAEFSDGFADIVAETPDAKAHKEDIKTKVLSGMSLEDAKYAVLGKAGLLGGNTQITLSAGGGSASVGITPQKEKTISEMTQAERREALMNAPDLVDILAPKRPN